MAKAPLTVTTDPGKATLNNSGTVSFSRKVLVSQIELLPAFQNMLKINPKVLEKIAESMKKNGFDHAQPLHVWVKDGKLVLIDGHTRRESTLLVGISMVSICEHTFENEDEAMEYAVSLQTNRRNLSDEDLMSLLQKGNYFNPERAGRRENGAGKLTEEVAKKHNVSAVRVERAKRVLEKGTPEIKAAVESGTMTINQAHLAMKKSTPKEEVPIIDVPEIVNALTEEIVEEAKTEEHLRGFYAGYLQALKLVNTQNVYAPVVKLLSSQLTQDEIYKYYGDCIEDFELWRQ